MSPFARTSVPYGAEREARRGCSTSRATASCTSEQWGRSPLGIKRADALNGWGRAIYEDYGHLVSIRYRAAHQGGMAVALWETAPAVVGLPGQDRALQERGVWERIVVGLALQGRAPVKTPPADCSQCRDYGLA